jgi:hypothetical protein
VDERRASLDIALVDADVDLRVEKGLQDRHYRVPQGLEKCDPTPGEMVDGRDIQALADDLEESWVVADEDGRMKEGSAIDCKIPKKVGQRFDLDFEKPIRSQFDCVGEVCNRQAQ